MKIDQRFVVVDGIRTAYLEAGEGPTMVLLHSGEYGASAELCWEHNLEALAKRYRVIAPDWLGFGGTDKVFDFGGGRGRRVWHLRRVLETLSVDEAVFVGSSMGGSVLAATLATEPGIFPAVAAVLSSGGGFAPDNAARRRLLDYDCSLEAMRSIVEVLFHDPSWAEDEVYVKRRHDSSLVPGAWEATAAPRFKAPTAPSRSDFGQPDRTPYERIAVPVLVVAGADDPLREPGYGEQLAARIPHGAALTYEQCSHMPHIEHAERFNADVLRFLADVCPGSSGS